MNFAKFLRTSFLQNTFGGLLLFLVYLEHINISAFRQHLSILFIIVIYTRNGVSIFSVCSILLYYHFTIFFNPIFYHRYHLELFLPFLNLLSLNRFYTKLWVLYFQKKHSCKCHSVNRYFILQI